MALQKFYACISMFLHSEHPSKEVSTCQMSHLKTLCQLSELLEVVYHFYKSFRLLSQYTSYKLGNLSKVVPMNSKNWKLKRYEK